MCRLKTFCCCCTLRSAAITGAIWNTIYVISMFCACGLYLHAYFTGDRSKVPPPDESDSKVIQHVGITKNVTTEEDLSTQHLALGIYGGIRGLFALLVLVFLIIGIKKERASYLCPWLVMVMLFIVPGYLQIISLFILGVHWAELIGELLIYSFWLYVWIAVYSYYKELQEGGPTTATAYVA